MAEQEVSALRMSFGRQCRLLREYRKLTRDDVGEPCSVSGSMIGAVERGERIPDTALIHNLDQVLGAHGLLASVSDFMAAEKYRAFFRNFAALERQCYSLNAYAPLLVPGLLQTEEYARATFRMRAPSWDDDEIEKQVAARMERQQVLKRVPRPFLGFVIEESVLRRPIGGREVLRKQVKHLLDCARLYFVTMQVMPMDSEEHVALDGMLSLLISKEHQHYAYVEHHGGSQLIVDKEQVSLLQERYGILRSQALSPRESARFIEKLAGEL
ncbi:helix-turn-helix domain-containing protein [Streptomyces marincola]|uniref:HTH cro/C1-type domain-containing protein n=1 Tax=Streptomyces marincola TaxID=2878388 RepID=A0A1W7CY99_9ACTN|nr:helix-turn-helix transcriptional regulator [Streptomyces marincola]ARQ69695.1 hypothetical protein CAG99_13205 [Streptomyces marincola]